MKFKPMLCPNEKIYLDNLNYPITASVKLDGIRCIFHPELEIVSRSLKPIQNKQLKDKFAHILEYAKTNNLILDGEIYSPKRTFQEISRAVMTQDFSDEKTIKKLVKEYNIYNKEDLESEKIVISNILELLEDMEFYCFDVLNLSVTNNELFPFKNRHNIYESINLKYFNPVNQIIMNTKENIKEFFEEALKTGNEGLILKSLDGRYKFGRGTINEGLCFKVKPFETFDAKIVGVTERFENTNESFKNQLGQSTKRNTIDNKEGTGIAACFIVEYMKQDEPNGDPNIYDHAKPVITGSEDFRREIWHNKESYIGKMIEYKAMMIGSKDVPRHPVFLRFREDRD